MKIKILVDRSTYSTLKERGQVKNGCAVNDIVSTTRRDPSRERHEYESRRSIVLAAVRGSGARGVSVKVYDDRHVGRPLLATVLSVGPVFDDGVRFMIAMRYGGVA